MKKLFYFLSFFLIFSTILISQPDTLTILHVNDSHSTLEAIGPRDANLKGTLGGISRVATLVGMTKMTEPNVLFLHAGDISIGDVFFNKFFQVPEFQLLSALGLDAMTLGNHEFDLGPEVLLGSLQYAFPDPNDAFPLLSANTDFTAVSEMQNYVKDYVIKDYGNTKVGIFGLTTPATNLLSNPSPAVISEDIAAIAGTMVETLKSAGCDVVIFLSHLGVDLDKMIASNIPGINVIVSGHDHYMYEQPIAITDPLGGTTWIVQARSNYMYAGEMKLVVDNTNVQLLNYQLIPIDENIPQEPSVQAIVDGMIAEIESFYGIPFFTQPFGYANSFIEEEAKDLLKLGAHDTPAGNLVADAFRAFTSTDIALQAGGSMALPLWQGTFTAGDLFRVNGYGFNLENTLGFQLVTFDFTGMDILTGLEFGLSEIEMNDEFLLQVSGMEYAYDGSKPAGERLVNVKINGSTIDPQKVYSVTANEMVLAFMSYIGITPVNAPQFLTGLTEFQALMAYVMEQNNFVEAKTLGRVMNVGDQTSFAGMLGSGWMEFQQPENSKNKSADNKLFFEIKVSDLGLNYQPKGNLNIRIPSQQINLKSDYCEWLLIENYVATIKGEGKINNKGHYGYLITAIDGENNKMEFDKLRIVIWDKDDGDKLLFDNQVPGTVHGVIKMSTDRSFAKDLDEDTNSVPQVFALEQNYPNPFNPSTKISYSIPTEGNVELKVYDILGNVVATLVNESKSPGNYSVTFDASALASGVYIYSLKANNLNQTKKMLLMK